MGLLVLLKGNVMSEKFYSLMATQKLNREIGDNDLEFEYSIAHCQSDYANFHGVLETPELINIANKLLARTDLGLLSSGKAHMRAIVTNWFDRLSIECTLDGENRIEVEASDTLHDLALEEELSFISEDSSFEVYERCEDVACFVISHIIDIANDLKRTISTINMNLDTELRPEKIYKTKNFKVIITEERINFLDDIAEEESFVLETAEGLENESMRAFDLFCEVFKLEDGEYNKVGSSALCSIVVTSDDEAQYRSFMKYIVSEAICSARNSLKNQLAA